MLKLKDKNKNLVAGLINYKDLCIESILATGDKKLSFSLHKEDKFYNLIEEECYIETKTQEYVIKARDVGVDYTRFDCVLNLEELEANIFDRFESVEQTITASLNLAIVGTGWTVKDNTLKKKRTVRCTNKNALEIVQEIKKTYRVDIVFNTLEKKIEIYEHLGEDKGTYFIDSLNLTALQVQSDSYKFATRIIAEGKNGLTFSSINNGKNYVENYQYSRKVKTIYWKDERYTVKESLLEDAKAKLEEISKPYTSYNASILNLAELNSKYKNILDYQLGDTITLISRNNKVKDKQRIVKTVEYPQDHSRDTVELANAILKFEDIQQENQETTDTVNNITSDNGTLDSNAIEDNSIEIKKIDNFEANVLKVTKLDVINANIENLHANKADIQDLNAVKARIGTLEATKANITQLNAVSAEISKLSALKADITDLNAANGKINVLESKTASIDNLLAGNLTANNFKANSIVAGSAIIAENAIGSSQISSLTANKITTGTIDTSLVTVAGPNGRLIILGNRLQIFDDVNNRLFERIMLGINDKNRACLTLRATDGQTVLLTEEGLTKAGITDGFGKADDNSLSALKLDKNSIVRQVNGATETIAGTRIQVGDRTLDIELSTQKNTITEHGKELSSQKATIQALDNAIKLKVDSQTFTQSTTTINNNINKAKEEAINSANSNTTNSINNIKFGGRNYYLNSSFNKTLDNWSTNDPIIVIKDGYLIMDARNITGPYLDTQQTFNVDGEGIYTMSLDVAEANGTCYMYAIDKTDTDAVQPYTDNCFTLQSKKRNFKVIEGRKGTTRFWSVIRAMKGSYLKCRLAKFEKGNKNSDWTPAPEDVQAYAEEVAKAKADLAKTEAIANSDGKITEEERKRIQQAQENLNTAIARADKAKADSQAYSDALGKQLKANAEKYANDVAIAKAELAKQQSKAYSDGIVTEEEKKRIKQAEDNLNIAIAKANEAENKAREYADAKKIEAINKASADASLKAAEALNNAKAFTTAEISTTNSNLHKVTSEINILKEKIESKVGTVDVEKAIQSIKLGGRNLLRNTQDFKDWNLGRGTILDQTYNGCKVFYCKFNGNGFTDLQLTSCITPEPNKTYTLSFWAKGSSDMDSYFYPDAIKGGSNSQGKKTIASDGSINTKLSSSWERYWITWTTKDNVSGTKHILVNRLQGSSEKEVYVCGVKLEEGNKPTDWTPAPEDTNKTIADNIKTVTDKISTVESKFTQENNSIKASVQDLNSTTQSITTNVSNINRDLTSKINSNLDAAKSFATDIAIAKANLAKEQAIANADGKITEEERKRIQQAQENLNVAIARADKAKQEAINSANSHADSKANEALNNAKAYTNAEITTVNSKVHNVESNLNILSNEIKSKVSQSDIDKSISAIKIGGRNLILDSRELNNFSNKLKDKIDGFSILTGDATKITSNYIEVASWNNIISPLPDTEYTLSFYAKGVGSFISYFYPESVQSGYSNLGAKTNAPDGAIYHSLTNEWRKYVITWKTTKTISGSKHIIASRLLKGNNSIQIYGFKFEEGTKATDWTPAPEDTNQLIVDNIKVVNTKINDVSSNVTQLRDSVTTQINSINSKTQSIETTLGSKASKQEVTEVNNRVATIKASLDSITQRVSSTESKTQTLETNLNGKASKQEVNNVNSRVANVEINLNGITNRVSSTESRINTLNGQVQNAATKQEFTEFKQTSNNFQAKIEEGNGGNNLIVNSGFNGLDGFSPVSYQWNGVNSSITWWKDNSEWVINGTNALVIQGTNGTHGSYGVRQEQIKLKPNTTYTLSGYAAAHRGKWRISIAQNDWAWIGSSRGCSSGGKNPKNWDRFVITFTTGPAADYLNNCKIDLMLEEAQNNAYAFFSNIMLNEGNFAMPWQPQNYELYGNNMVINKDKLRCTFEDGTYAEMGRDGFEWYNAGTGHAYHALTYVTSFDIPIGNPGKAYIKLPAEFTKRRSSLKWTVALRGYYYNTTGNFFPFHVHCTGARDYIENGLVVCEVQGLCKIQNGSNSGDIQFRPLTAMLIAIA